MRVLKFGGSSLADGGKFLNAAKIIHGKSKASAIAVVVSAPKGVTNTLETLTETLPVKSIRKKTLDEMKKGLKAITGFLEENLSGFNAAEVNAAHGKRLDEIATLLTGAVMLGVCPANIKAEILACGERFSARILKALLVALGRDAAILEPSSFLVTSAEFLNAVPNLAQCREKFAANPPGSEKISILPGFTGVNEKGQLTTLGRDGSDVSAAVLAVCANADCCEIWTDVEGIYSADPRIISGAALLDDLSYQEAMELSNFGARVLHPRTIGPLAQFKIPCLLKNSMNPTGKGTRISGSAGTEKTVKAITHLDNLTVVNVVGPGMKGMVGMASRVFAAISREDISVILISRSSSESCISFCIHNRDAQKAKNCLEEEFELERKNELVYPISFKKNLSIISLVGDGMRHKKGIAARFFSSLAQARVNVVAIAQDSFERSISAVIAQHRSIDALKVCHQRFFSHKHSIDAFVIGFGTVGGELLRQIGQQQGSLNDQGIDLRVYGIANSKGIHLKPEGIDLSKWSKGEASKINKFTIDTLKEFVQNRHLVNPVIIDCTSSEEIARAYPKFLANGFHVVTTNKKANTASWDSYLAIRKAARQTQRRFLYETNVGAGLPVIDTLQGLLRAGDRLTQFEGILSGSLSYIFGKLDDGISLSKAAAIALDKGFTEPDPRDDLSGLDVARKLLILAREAGMPLELEDITIAQVLPDKFDNSGSVERFMKNLENVNGHFQRQFEMAKKEGKVLRYIGRIQDGKCSVSIEAVARDHPFYGVKDGENALAIHSAFYQPIPFVIRGYGAGAQVTAAGVFSDLLRTLAWVQEEPI
ncbi:MAG: bifunctional aspartate kinase/homoserine dehydrogenase I [Sphingomonadales bacterium]